MQTCQNGTSAKSTLDDIAKELNMSKRNLQRALRIERNLTDSMKELLYTGEITKTFALFQNSTSPVCVFHTAYIHSYFQAIRKIHTGHSYILIGISINHL